LGSERTFATRVAKVRIGLIAVVRRGCIRSEGTNVRSGLKADIRPNPPNDRFAGRSCRSLQVHQRKGFQCLHCGTKRTFNSELSACCRWSTAGEGDVGFHRKFAYGIGGVCQRWSRPKRRQDCGLKRRAPEWPDLSAVARAGNDQMDAQSLNLIGFGFAGRVMGRLISLVRTRRWVT